MDPRTLTNVYIAGCLVEEIALQAYASTHSVRFGVGQAQALGEQIARFGTYQRKFNKAMQKHANKRIELSDRIGERIEKTLGKVGNFGHDLAHYQERALKQVGISVYRPANEGPPQAWLDRMDRKLVKDNFALMCALQHLDLALREFVQQRELDVDLGAYRKVGNSFTTWYQDGEPPKALALSREELMEKYALRNLQGLIDKVEELGVTKGGKVVDDLPPVQDVSLETDPADMDASAPALSNAAPGVAVQSPEVDAVSEGIHP